MSDEDPRCRTGALANRADGVAETAVALDWTESLPVTPEAAVIETELLDQATPINPLDMLIAGVVREAGSTLVTRDYDFERVEELDGEYLARTE